MSTHINCTLYFDLTLVLDLWLPNCTNPHYHPLSNHHTGCSARNKFFFFCRFHYFNASEVGQKSMLEQNYKFNLNTLLKLLKYSKETLFICFLWYLFYEIMQCHLSVDCTHDVVLCCTVTDGCSAEVQEHKSYKVILLHIMLEAVMQANGLDCCHGYHWNFA